MLQDVQRTFLRLWQQLSWAQRLTIIGLSGASVLAIYLLISWANAPTYGLLFSGLSSQDAGAIVTQLQADKVPYQLTDGGATIMVPQAMVDAERLALANKGLPQDGVVGFSIFDKTSIFQSDSFTQQIDYTRALEGELTKTIGQVDGVLYDRVNIVLPQQALFSSQQDSPTASVLLKLGPAASLSSGQIAGIQHLVSSAVQGLKPENVTVVDGNGTILSTGTGTTGDMGLTALQAQQRYASTLEAQLTAMLDSVLGPDHAVVNVQAAMDWTQQDSTSNIYQPQSPASPLTSSHVSESLSGAANGSNGGLVGLGSNVPTYGTTVSGTIPLSQSQRVTDLTFTNSMTTTHSVSTPGTITHLSVAVLLNNVTDAARVNALRQALINAAGINLARGDQFSIASVPFDNSLATAAAKAAAAQQQQNMILSIIRWAALIIVPLVLLLLLWRLLVPKRRAPTYDAYDFPDDVGLAPLDPFAATPNMADTMVLPGGAQSVMRESLAEMAREKPELVAGLIGRWMEEDHA